MVDLADVEVVMEDLAEVEVEVVVENLVESKMEYLVEMGMVLED